MTKETLTKVAVVFPCYRTNDSTHYHYWYRLFEEAQKMLDLYLVFESGDRPTVFHKAYVQKLQLKPLNLIERFIIIVKLRLQGYKHIYVHYSEFSLLLAKIVTFLFGGKTYLWDCEYFEQRPENKWQLKAINLTDVLVTGHKKIAEQYRNVCELGNKRIMIVQNWVVDESEEINKTEVKKHDEKKRILFIHHLSSRKGSRELPDIIENVISNDKNIKFVIVGDGPDFDWLKKEIERRQLGAYVDLKGQVQTSEVKQLFTSSDMLIMPSRSEGFPRVILEAMKYGVPYAATDVGCVKEISPQCLSAFVSAKDNMPEYLKTVQYLLSLSESRIQTISKEMQQWSKQYSLQNATTEFISLFK